MNSDSVRFYTVGGITLAIHSDIPITSNTFAPKLELFQKEGDDKVNIFHHCGIPQIKNWGKKVYHKAPWIVYETSSGYIYRMPVAESDEPSLVATFNKDYSEGHIYKGKSMIESFKRGNLHSLLCFPTDQILLVPLLTKRKGLLIHASGLILNKKGYLFVGHSEAGKSTIVKMFKDKAKILCDDRIIVREVKGRFLMFGTYSHGEVEEVSPDVVPINAVFFLNKSRDNKIEPATQFESMRKFLECSIKSLVTKEWAENAISLSESLAKRVPCYNLYFDMSGEVVELVTKM